MHSNKTVYFQFSNMFNAAVSKKFLNTSSPTQYELSLFDMIDMYNVFIQFKKRNIKMTLVSKW